MAHGRDIGQIHRLVWLRFDRDAQIFVVRKQRVNGVEQIMRGLAHVFRLAHVGALACQPQDHQVAAQLACDVRRDLGSLQRILAFCRRVGSEAAIDRLGVFPQAGRHKLGYQPVVLQQVPHLRGCAADLCRAHLVQIRHGIIIVKLHCVVSQLLVELKLLCKAQRWPHIRTEWVATLMDVPGAKGELVSVLLHQTSISSICRAEHGTVSSST